MAEREPTPEEFGRALFGGSQEQTGEQAQDPLSRPNEDLLRALGQLPEPEQAEAPAPDASTDQPEEESIEEYGARLDAQVGKTLALLEQNRERERRGNLTDDERLAEEVERHRREGNTEAAALIDLELRKRRQARHFFGGSE